MDQAMQSFSPALVLKKFSELLPANGQIERHVEHGGETFTVRLQRAEAVHGSSKVLLRIEVSGNGRWEEVDCRGDGHLHEMFENRPESIRLVGTLLPKIS